MSEHVGYIVEVKQLREHSNADRMRVATFFGNDTCVDLNVKIGDKGIYFPTDLQLSIEFCEQNNLVRKKDANGNNIGGYMDPSKRNVTTIRLRGEKSDGLYLPIECLAYTGVNLDSLTIGTPIDVVNGHAICCKYIPRGKVQKSNKEGNRTRKKKVPVAPLFTEHADTEQLAYNLGEFHPGDEIEITLKMHGTSQRTAYVPVLQGFKRTLWDRICGKPGQPIYDWGYVSGTRRTVLDNFDGGFYGSNEFREAHSKFFEGKLHKGEEVYYEVVGFQTSGAPIMGSAANKKTADKEFIKQYGDTTVFSYGCDPTEKKTLYGNDDDGAFELPIAVPQSDFYVYRMTITNEDGDVVEYTPDYMRYRCEQMGCKTVPLLAKATIDKEGVHVFNDTPYGYPHTTSCVGDTVQEVAEKYYDGPDPIGKTHVREGVVVRIVNKPKFCAFKHKNFYFKALEGIIKADAEAPDMEEAEEVLDGIE
jgi:hypothetical protein